MEEDLSQNIFFKTVKFKFPKLFQTVETKGYTLCIPQYSSLYGMNITQKIVESHILIESKYYQSEFDTLGNDKESYIFENGLIIHKQEPSKKLKILFDEICYNKEYKSYRLLCIEAPLVGGTGIVPQTSESDFGTIEKPKRPTFDHSIEFLGLIDNINHSPNSIVIRKADQQLLDFESKYQLIKGCEKVLKEKLTSIHERVLEDLICANAEYKVLQSNEKQISNLSMILESYIMGKLNNKIYFELKNLYQRENQQLFEMMIQLSKYSLDDLGIKRQFESHLTDSLKMMMFQFNIEEQTPLDKLFTVVDASTKIEQSIKATSLLENVDKDIFTITADDSLPILSYLLIQSRPKYLESDLQYCTNFIFTDIQTSSLGYHLVNFIASIDYIKSLGLKYINNGNSNGEQSTSPNSNFVNNNNNNNNEINNQRKNSFPTIPTFNATIDNSSSNNNNRKSLTLSQISQQNNQFTSTPNLFNFNSNNNSNNNNTNNYSSLNSNSFFSPNKQNQPSSPPPNSISTPLLMRDYSRAPNVISLNDDEDALGDFIGRLREIKDDVVVSTQFK